jgi:type III pantothenate kinase
MKQSLVVATAAISKTDGRLADFPDNTADAIHSGALRAMAGAIEAMCDKLQAREGRMPICLVGGGDAAALLPALHRSAQMTDNLVLQGLVLMVGEMA